MQQPMAQQHDMGAQQALSQQMVLCPVRFVYETQILVQPGDQIQPNQTFFINPQNPPPWMQNSLQRQALSNPVVYVQQLQNNNVPSIQQPMDQNQLYLQQNFANFQLQQQMLAQNSQEMRPTMQLANIVPNIVQNIQTSAPNERPIQNAQIIHNQIQRPMQNQMVNQVDQRQVYMRPQMHQQTNIQRPMMAMNQMQNMQQQALVNMQNMGQVGQTFVPNIVRPVTNMRPSIPNNVVNVQPVPKIREITPSEINNPKPMNHPIGNVVPTVRNFGPNNYYRPIQPRPQMSNNMPKPQHIPVQTIQNTPMYNIEKTPQASNNYAIIQQLNTPINRKRKSESPDEIQKKMAPIKQNYSTPSVTVTKLVSEIGTNTSPVHRARITIPVDINTIKKFDSKECIVDKDKLIRNTVYPQARGRLLQDKVEEIRPPTENKVDQATLTQENIAKPIKIIEQTKVIEIQNKIIEPPKVIDVQNKMIEQQKNIGQHNKMTVQSKNVTNIPPKPIKAIADQPKIVENKILKPEPMEISETVPVAETAQVIKEAVDTIVTDTNDNTVEVVNSDVTVNNKEEKEANMRDSNRLTIKQENINILTHVVDGYVIQESNFAFPIRKPLKEKTLQNQKPQDNDKLDLIRESIKEELKNNSDIPLLPFHYLLLDSAKEEKEKAEEKEVEEEEGKDNPFNRLQHSTVKSWTVDDLCAHLLKFSWKDTVSLLQDHEIDGESLYLVSKPQLLKIGVAEEHADIICEFVKS